MKLSSKSSSATQEAGKAGLSLPRCIDRCWSGRRSDCGKPQFVEVVSHCLQRQCDKKDVLRCQSHLKHVCGSAPHYAYTGDPKVYEKIVRIDLRTLQDRQAPASATPTTAPTLGGDIISTIPPASQTSVSEDPSIISRTRFGPPPWFTMRWTSAATPETTSAIPTLGSQTTPTTTPAPSSNGGLSAAAKVGLGVGVPLAVIIIGIIAFVAYRYGRRKAKQEDRSPDYPGPPLQPQPEAEKVELDNAYVAEMEAKAEASRVAELTALKAQYQDPAELPGSPPPEHPPPPRINEP